MANKSVFGNMLSTYRFLKQHSIDEARKRIWERNNLERVAARDGYEIREDTRVGGDGSSVTKLELWHRVDVERVKISSNVTAEVIEEDKPEEDEDDWL